MNATIPTQTPRAVNVRDDFTAFAAAKGHEHIALSWRDKLENSRKQGERISEWRFALYGATTLNSFEVYRFAHEHHLTVEFREATAYDLGLARGKEYITAYLFSNMKRPCDVHDSYDSHGSEAALSRHLASQRIEHVRAWDGFIADADRSTILAVAAEWNSRSRVRPIQLDRIEELEGGATYFYLCPDVPRLAYKDVLAA